MKHRRTMRLFLSLLISLSIATPTWAKSEDSLPPQPTSLSSVTDTNTDSNDSDPNDRGAIEKIADYDLLDTTYRYHAAYVQARTRMLDLQTQIGIPEFNRRLNSNKVVFNIGEFGQVAFTTIDGQPVARIIHKESGVALIFVEKSAVEESSAHIKLYAAKQHFDANLSRDPRYIDLNNKIKRFKGGRDTVFVWLSDPKENETEQSMKIDVQSRPVKQSKAWWAEWRRATLEKPAAYHVRLGMMAGTFQAALAVSVGTIVTTTAGLFGVGPAAAEHYDSVSAFATTLGHGLEYGSLAAIPSLVFGTTLGVFTRTYNTWRMRGSQAAQFAKNSVVSVIFYLGIKSVTEGGLDQMNFITGDNPAKAAENVAQFGLVTLGIKGLQKGPTNGFSDLEAAERSREDWITRKMPTLSKNSENQLKLEVQPVNIMKRVDYNRQFKYYWPRNTLNLLDQMWFTTMMTAYLAGDAPAYAPWFSTAVLVASIPVSWKLLNVFAKKYYPDAPLTARYFRESRAFLDPRVMVKNTLTLLSKGKNSIKRSVGIDTRTDDEKFAEMMERENLPRESQPAFPGQTHEGIGWFRPETVLNCELTLTGKKAI